MRRMGFYSLVLVVILWSTLPFLWQFITSVKPVAQLTLLPPLFPRGLDLSSYPDVFLGRPFGRFIMNSALVAAVTTIFCVIVGSFAAYAISRMHFFGRGMILALILSVSMFPPIATVSPLFLLIRWLGLRDNVLALIFTYVTFAMPLSIWIMTSFFRGIP